MAKLLTDKMLTQIHEAGLPDPELEHRFHPERRWRMDMVWVGLMIALEVEGGTWIRGRHNRPQGYSNDCEKYSEAAILGWIVIRVTADMIKSGKAIDLLKRAIEAVS